jgi:transglutaminase-like putative cysteine protease
VKRVRVGCEFDYHTESPVPMLILVSVRPDDGHEIVYQSRWTNPDVHVQEYRDVFGNVCWRLVTPGGPFTIRYDAVVDIEGLPDPVLPDLPLRPVQDLPSEALVYTLPSRYVESDLLMDTAWELFGDTPPTWARVQAICDWVHGNITFQMGASTPTTTATHIYEQRIGVCRDFALLSVAFCRALNIPARYGFGYLPDIEVVPPDVPMDFHSWFEAFVGDRWYTFDARHNEPRVGRIFVGRGRDAVDVALSTSYGAARLDKMTVWSDEVAADFAGGPPREDDADALEAAERVDTASDVVGPGTRPGF